MKKKSEYSLDILVAALLAIIIFVGGYFLQGFETYGIDTPLAYGGGDDFTQYVTIKTIGEKGWFWINNDLGAPYSRDAFDFPANFLMNTEDVISKIIYFFTKNAFSTMNIQYLFTFVLCGLSAYLVLRILKYQIPFALFGALLYAFAPYIFARGIEHYCLTACYFVPCSILLCIWAYDSDIDYMRINRKFFSNKKNICTILFAALIANNGIGYYSIFTCFFLLIVAIYAIGTGRRLRIVYKSMLIIALIFLFFIIAISPTIVYWIFNGKNTEVAARSIADAELYGLKIIQLFIPINGHGIPILEKIISAYNSNMPLVNENYTAYLGIGAGLGFLLSLAGLFVQVTKDTKDKLRLYTRLNICAILFATIGGFSAIIFIAHPFLRGYNRISIFIMFISICTLCHFLQRAWMWCMASRKRKVIYVVVVCALVVVSMYDQLPRYGANDQILTANSIAYDSDHEFVERIESQLQSGDMVFQLPYHSTPEKGPVNNMADYQLYTGYLHSNSLKWSYGGNAGRKADQWNKYVASLPIKSMTETIVSNGFKGIYIDARAYKEGELKELLAELQNIICVEPIVSDNGNLIFFNLYPFYYEHMELINQAPLSDVEIENSVYYRANELLFDGDYASKNYGEIVMNPGAVQFGPYESFDAGTYTVYVYGEDLKDCTFDVTTNQGETEIPILFISKTNNSVSYQFTVSEETVIEMRSFNRTNHNTELHYIRVEKEN